MWTTAKELRVPLDTKLTELQDLPHTVSFVIRKRIQVDNLNQLPKEKRPTVKMMWEGTSEEIDEFLERVCGKDEPTTTDIIISEIEG